MVKILIVEDNEPLAELLVDRLERRGHQVMHASDRDAAFSSAKASQPDVILLEGQMRGGEDWDIARALKYDDHTREIPIIGLTGNGGDEERETALQNGCSEVHYKPVDFVRLLAQIETAAPRAAPETATED